MDFKRFESRVINAVTIPGTLTYNAFIPLKSINRILKEFSQDENNEIYPKIKRPKSIGNQN